VTFLGARTARPAKHVIRYIREAKGIIISPSNPIASIGAILAVSGIRLALQKTRAKVVGISPIVGGKTVKGPADKLMKALGLEPTALGVAKYYRDFLDTFIIDRVDRKLTHEIERLGVKTLATNTLMKTMADKIQLARIAISEL
jgi:LPPG:FO 2-phospho-L-lactate transferase